MDETLHSRYALLDSDREAALNRKRVHAALTIPSLLPPEGKAQHQALDVPYASTSAEGVNALASRIVSVVLPLNNQPIFELMVQRSVVPEGEDTTDFEAVMGRFERSTMDVLAPTNLRSSAYLVYRHLIVVGDCLLFMQDDYDFRVFRADQYVVRRRHEGQWMEIIIEEAVDPEYYPDLAAIQGDKQTLTRGPIGGSALQATLEPLYTQIKRDPKTGEFHWTQEFRGKESSKGNYKVCPYIPMRWNAVAGEDYGTSLVEDMFGDVRALDALAKALIDGALLNAEYRWGVNPAGITELQDVLDSINGSFVPCGPNDIFPLQFQNASQVSATQAAVAHRETVLGRRFLMNTAVQPQGERVTARQVSIIAQELESNLGGVLSQASRELQVPVIRRTLLLQAQGNLIPEQLQDFIKEDSILKIRVRAGLEILNREAEREKLDMAIERMRNLPETALRVFKWEAVAKDWWESMGLESAGRIKTAEEMAAEVEAAVQQQQAAAYQEGAIKAGVSAAGRAAPAGE